MAGVNKKGFRNKLIGGALALFGLQAFWSSAFVYPTWRKDYSPVKDGRDLVSGALSADQMLFALAGFREMIAGILWVRADSFFDTGNYDAILPIIRLVTFLDPHQIDVYATGMWHIGYNFTDEDQRSDRRYIPAALALGEEGAKQNKETYELFFETAWMWYHKIDDNYDKSVYWMKQAYERPDMLPARKNLLGRLYERAGKPEESLKNWYVLRDAAAKRVADDVKERDYQARSNLDTIDGNIDTTIVRMVQRGYIASKEGRSLENYDVNPPFNVGFSAKVVVTSDRVLRIQGTWNVLPVGTRIRFILRDKNYKNAIPGGMQWDADSTKVNLDPPTDSTFLQEQLFVRNTRFDKKVDMTRDPTMYPLTQDEYVMEFYYNARSAPQHIQDKFSWNGEGMTDVVSDYVNTQIRPGQKCIFVSLPITRDQLLLRGKWADTPVVIKTPNYVETDKSYNKPTDMIDTPGLAPTKK
jgi:hypothetical protein